MLTHQSEPIHTSLSDHSERRVRIGAIQCFHLILGYMEKDTRLRKYKKPRKEQLYMYR